MSELRSNEEQWAKLADEATPGPWVVETEGGIDITGEGWFHVEVSFEGGVDHNGDKPGLMLGDHEGAEADAAFIAAARTAVPSLLAEVTRLRAKIEAANAIHARNVDRDGIAYCVTCVPIDRDGDPAPGLNDWPCPTVAALAEPLGSTEDPPTGAGS